MDRTADELGRILRTRRTTIGRTQQGVVDKAKAEGHALSEPTYRQIERGAYSSKPGARTLVAISVGLDWPPGALSDIVKGADPDHLELTVMSQSVDMERLRDVDPDSYELVVKMVETALARAEARR